MSAGSGSLKEVLRLAFSEPVTWLCGEQEIDRPVNWVSSSLADARSGDILLLPACQLTPHLVEDGAQLQLAALLLIGEPDGSTPALTASLPVVLVPESSGDLRQVQRLIVTILVNQRASLMERGVRIHTQLSQIEAEGLGLPGLVKAMAEISSRGVLVQDKRGVILAEHASSTLLGIWGDVLEQLRSLDSLPDFLIDRKRAGSSTAVLTQQFPGSLERLITPITVGEIARGYLSLVGLEKELDALDFQVIEQGSLVCAIELARSKAIREAEKRLKGDLLTALLQDNLSPREARLWVQEMGLDLSQAHAALRFAWDSPAPPSRRRLETLVNGEVARLGAQVIVSLMEEEVICFCQMSPQAKSQNQALLLAQAVLEQSEREFPKVPLRCGVGIAALALEDWRTSLRQAGQALELARRLGKATPLYYPDLSVYRLLYQLEHHPELVAFKEETLGPLLEYEGAGELVHTLEVYFEHHGNLSQTAEALYIHRNTLIYRMDRIAAITRLDLDKSEDRLALQLALRIFHMLGEQSH